MEGEAALELVQRLPLQAAPVARTVIYSATSGEAGVEACDNDHNLFVYGPGCCGGKSSTTGN